MFLCNPSSFFFLNGRKILLSISKHSTRSVFVALGLTPSERTSGVPSLALMVTTLGSWKSLYFCVVLFGTGFHEVALN